MEGAGNVQDSVRRRFGPIVRDTGESRSCTEKCSVSRSKKKVTAIFIPKCCRRKDFCPVARFSGGAVLVLAKIPGLTIFPAPQAWL